MTQIEFATAYLNAVQKKYEDYFTKAGIDILQCVLIKGEGVVSVHVIKSDLPFDIRHDIEMMFWKH